MTQNYILTTNNLTQSYEYHVIQNYTLNTYNSFKKSLKFLVQDYILFPPYVTLNNILKEFNSFKEPAITSFTKVMFMAQLPAFGIDNKHLKEDSTHRGQYIQNYVSGTKNLVLWYYQVPRGTRVHGLDRPISDIYLKGTCKIKLESLYHIIYPSNKKISSSHQFAVNAACELLGYTFLTGNENITDKNKTVWSFSNWVDVLSDSSLWTLNVRKALGHTYAAQIGTTFAKTVEHLISPILSYIIPMSVQNFCGYDLKLKDLPLLSYTGKKIYSVPFITSSILGVLKTAEAANSLLGSIPLVKSFVPKIPIITVGDLTILPSISLWAVNVMIGSIVIPLVRTFTYTTNENIASLVENKNEISCIKLKEYKDLINDPSINITYSYDAIKVNPQKIDKFHYCKSKKHTYGLEKNYKNEDLSENSLVIYSPKEEDYLGKVGRFIHFCVNQPQECLLETSKTLLHELSTFAEQTKIFTKSAVSNPYILGFATYIAAEIMTSSLGLLGESEAAHLEANQ